MMVGSSVGMDGPSCVRMPPPELTPLPPFPAETPPLPLMLTPVRLTLVGPGATPCPRDSQHAAAFGAPQNFTRQQRPVALHFDVDIVFNRERDHILRGQIKVAGADQRSASAESWPG